MQLVWARSLPSLLVGKLMSIRGVSIDTRSVRSSSRRRWMGLSAAAVAVAFLSGFVGCERKTAFERGEWVDKFDKVSDFAPIDIVFFIDTSFSMHGVWTAMNEGFTAFADRYLDPNQPDSLVDVRVLFLRQDAFLGADGYKDYRKLGVDEFEVVLDTIDPATGVRKPTSQIRSEFNVFVTRNTTRLNGHFLTRYFQSLIQGLVRQLHSKREGIRPNSTRIFLTASDADSIGDAEFNNKDDGYHDQILPIALNISYICSGSGPRFVLSDPAIPGGSYPLFHPVCMKPNQVQVVQNGNSRTLEYRQQPIPKTRLDIDSLFRAIDGTSGNAEPRWMIKAIAPYKATSVISLRKTWGCSLADKHDPARLQFDPLVTEPNIFSTPPVQTELERLHFL